jgi:hypothetical protein
MHRFVNLGFPGLFLFFMAGYHHLLNVPGPAFVEP